MNIIERLGLTALHRLDPERAHDLSIRALAAGLVPLPGAPVTSERLRIELAGLSLPNPVGLAAGYDKNARATRALMTAGFGFVELGAATPRPQSGNPRPRLFRLRQDAAIINRFGFNNEGAQAIAARLRKRPAGIPVGLNIGANKDSADRAADFAEVVRIAGNAADFLTVNVSSPNTEKLRDLQGAQALAALLTGVIEARDQLQSRPRSSSRSRPIWMTPALPISPPSQGKPAYKPSSPPTQPSRVKVSATRNAIRRAGCRVHRSLPARHRFWRGSTAKPAARSR